MGVGRETHVVVGVETEIVAHVGFGRVFLAFHGEAFGGYAEVAIEHLLHRFLPDGVDGLVVAGGNGFHIGFKSGPELGEVEQAVAVREFGIGHHAFGSETVVLHAVDSVIERATLRKTGVTVGAHIAVGTVGIGFRHQKRLAKVELLWVETGVLAEGFAFEESKGRIGPAGTRVILVLDAGHGVGHNSGEDERIFFCGRCFGLSGSSPQGAEGCKGDEERFFHERINCY